MEMAGAMHGFDTMAFSAGIGENSDKGCVSRGQRARMGVKIDEEKNKSSLRRKSVISGSRLKMRLLPTNEEYMIS